MNPSQKGQLIVLEGPDGVGKSTLVKALTDKLNEEGIPTISISFPGQEAGTLGRAVYELHHDLKKYGLETIAPLCLQLLHVAAHIDAMERRIKPTLASGRSIILDRFWWSTWVYGLTNGVDAQTLHHLIDVEKRCWGDIKPHLAILVVRDIPFAPQPEHAIWDKLKANYETLSKTEASSHPVVTFKNEGFTATEAAQTLFNDFLRRLESFTNE